MKRIIIVILLLTIITFFCAMYYIKDKSTTTIDLINIDKLSTKFMNNYFDEVKKLTSSDYDNALIVISKKEIKKLSGAKKIIPSPNHQYILIFNDEKSKDEAIIKLKEDKNVLSIELNKNFTLFNDSNNESSNYNSWGIEKMGLDDAISQLNNMDTEEVTVAILDSGCDMELFNKYYNGRIVETYNAMNDKGMYDNNGHGTHIAGTIAEGTPNNVKILPVKQTDMPAISIITTIASLNWIVYNDKADVVNMSFGINERIESIYQTIESAKQKGIICVCAAGNDNVGAPFYPAAYDNTISIAAVDSNLNKSSFSNFGKEITFSLPGTAIKSINRNDTLLAENNYTYPNDGEDDFETYDGTSMATPHGACAVAILKSLNKDLNLENSIELLKKHSIDLGDDGHDIYYGHGFINFSDSDFCDGTNCDEHNVFSSDDVSSDIVSISLGDETYESLYNFGNNTNLLNMKIDIEYSNDIHIIKDLGELKNITIDNYDPYVSGEQLITVNYAGFSVNKTVMNHLEDGYEYGDYNTGTIELKSMIPTENYPKYIEVPEYYHGEKVENISSAVFNNKQDIVKIDILANIRYIETQAFLGCTKLSEVNIPDSVVDLGAMAFYQTPSLYSIVLPSNLTEIGTNVFSGSGINSITIPSKVNTIQSYSFVDINSLTEVIIEEGVQTIEKNAFSSNSVLNSITIPSTITNIENGAFSGDNAISNIVINDNFSYESVADSVTIVEKNTKRLLFANDNSTIPEDVHIVGPYAINGSIFKLPNTITTLEDYALYNSVIVILPTSISNIQSSSAFERSNEWDNQNFVHNGSYVHNYLDSNNIKYFVLENEDVTVYTTKTNYKAFEKVDEDDVSACIVIPGNKESYSDCTNAFLAKNFTIHYKNDNDSFRYGDDYFIVEVSSSITGESHNKNVEVVVDKATPSYELPTNITANFGDKLSEVALPSGFEWMDSTQTINEIGNVTYKVKFIPTDTTNFETVENIDIQVLVSSNKNVIIPNITLTNKVYDGTINIPSTNISVSNLLVSEYSVVSAKAENANVGQKIASVKLRLSDDKFLDYSFEGGLQEKEFSVNFEILKADINLSDQSKDVHVVFDGKEHGIDFNIDSSSNINIRFMDTNNEYTLTEVPKYTEIGTYVTKYKVYIDNNYNEYFGQKTLMIEDAISYVIDNYEIDESNKYISKVMVNTELDAFTSNITLGVGYEVNVDYKDIDNKKIIFTGGKTKIFKNSSLYREFTNIVIGDINGDGLVNSLDFNVARNHLTQEELLKGAYLKSSDINYDTKTNSADLLRLKLHLLGKKPI